MKIAIDELRKFRGVVKAQGRHLYVERKSDGFRLNLLSVCRPELECNFQWSHECGADELAEKLALMLNALIGNE